MIYKYKQKKYKNILISNLRDNAATALLNSSNVITAPWEVPPVVITGLHVLWSAIGFKLGLSENVGRFCCSV
jgi:hypothetical protein